MSVAAAVSQQNRETADSGSWYFTEVLPETSSNSIDYRVKPLTAYPSFSVDVPLA